MDAEDRVEILSFSPAFRALDIEDRRHLAEAFKPVYLSAGSALMLEGDEATSLYLVQTGRLRAFVHRGEVEVPVGDIGPGEVVGEMALLSDLNRSATVIAMRDSALLELSREVFDDLVTAHPGLLLELARLLVTRLHRTSGATHVGSDARSVVLLPVDGAVDVSTFTSELTTALGADTLMLDRQTVAAALGSDSVDSPLGTRRDVDVAQWFHKAEVDHDLVLYVADLDLTSWTRRCLRQADLVLLVSTADSGGVPTAAESEVLWGVDVAVRPRVMLAIVHPSSTEQPSGTSRLLERRSLELHHHLRSGSSADFARLARVVTGRAVALVLGGGGAHGFAHYGVLKAINEHRIPIDFVGGTSMGAVIAATVAIGWDIDESISTTNYVTIDRGSLIDFTPPVVSLSSGATLTEGMREGFGKVRIEDLWYPFFCVSTDLTEGASRIHTKGSLWRAVRSSIAIPGTFPPMRSSDGHVLVDGGVTNNLPVDVMTKLAPGATILAVDLREKAQLPSGDLPSDGVLSGWGVLGRRLNPFSQNAEVPRILDILLRSTDVASGPPRVQADLTFRPSLGSFGALDFKSWSAMIDVGYRYATEVLSQWPETDSLTDDR